MEKTVYNKKQLIKYLIWTFAIAWTIQAGAAILYANGLVTAGQLVIAASMFAPLLGVLLSGHGLRGMGWKPRLKGKIRFVIIAWFLPPVVTAIGAAMYFLVFPQHFDLSGQALIALAGEEAVAQMEAQGMSVKLYMLITVIACLTYAPALNIINSIGEEAGWRGFMYPQLKARFGKRAAWLLGGVIWSAWHWPLIPLIGYEYGYGYFGFPVSGMIVFCLFTISIGIISDWLYEQSGCIWIPALIHGSINAAATLPMAFCYAGSDAWRLLGPVPNGLIAGLPLIALGAVLFITPLRKTQQGGHYESR